MADKPKAPPATLWSRRDAVRRSGWAMVWSSITVAVVGAVRLLFPRVHFLPPTTVRLGSPNQFAVGEVATKWKKSHNLIVVRNEDGFFALRAICTHLGCIPNWKPTEDKLKCPCHGSGFRRTGINFEGPAPRPLERLKIFLDEEGQLVVDTAVRFGQEKGEWARKDAFLRLKAERGNGEA